MSYSRNLARIARQGPIVVGTVVDLRGLAIYGGNYPAAVETSGALSAGDGGGGFWRWDAASTAADNLGTVVLPTGHVGAGRWVRLVSDCWTSVTWFGAPANGVTDAWAAIQAAVNAGNNILFPAGVYAASRKISVGSNKRLLGEPSATLLMTGADHIIEINPPSGTGYENIHIESLVFKGQNARVTGAGIYGVRINKLTVKGCEFIDTNHDGISVSDCSHCTFDGNIFSNIGLGWAGTSGYEGNGISALFCADLTVSNNKMQSVNIHGVNLSYSFRANVENNDIIDVVNNAISMSGTVDTLQKAVTSIAATAGVATVVAPSHGLSNNLQLYIKGTSQAAYNDKLFPIIRIVDSNTLTMAVPTTAPASATGGTIQFFAGKISIKSNKLERAKKAAIWIENGSSNVIIDNNIISQAGVSGIGVFAGADTTLGAQDIEVTGNSISQANTTNTASRGGIQVTSATNILVAENLISESSAMGMRFDIVNNGSVHHNQLINCTGTGVVVDKSVLVMLRDNYILSQSSIGMSITGNANGVIADNYIFNCPAISAASTDSLRIVPLSGDPTPANITLKDNIIISSNGFGRSGIYIDPTATNIHLNDNVIKGTFVTRPLYVRGTNIVDHAHQAPVELLTISGFKVLDLINGPTIGVTGTALGDRMQPAADIFPTGSSFYIINRGATDVRFGPSSGYFTLGPGAQRRFVCLNNVWY